MRSAILLLAACGLAGCATVQPAGVRTYTFQDFKVALALQAGGIGGGCSIADAVLTNTSPRPLGYVYTDLVLVTPSGETIGTDGINFPPTDAGGRAHAGHADFTGLGGQGCNTYKMELRAR